MNNTSKRMIAAALTGALLLPTIATAEAGPRNSWNNNRGDHNQHYGSHRKQKGHNNNQGYKKHGNNGNLGAAVAAGVIGLAAGAILLGATRQPSYAGPPPVNYYPPAPYPGRVHGTVGYQPWSPAWYQYCSSKYRSFNQSTGTFTTYGGEQRFCQ
ncbi:BA14K family protein [Roseibium marinum]|uniref:Lectin-like protein BA14k n=1 Tax=Roseibium marinum TaxID=281252 RepID=A0A2S3UPR8_9HYPH|nr:BA14K family protein [Roseibium marinum]POF29580.1 BA14K-like protein [Roseibium marinum]